MAAFQTPIQRFIADGRLALWMLGAMPLLIRGLLSIAPFDLADPLSAIRSFDDATIGWLFLLCVVLRVYQYVASSLFESTTEHGRHYLRDKWGYEVWLGRVGVLVYLVVTYMLPLWVGALLDVVLLAIVVRYGRTRAKALVEELALFARSPH